MAYVCDLGTGQRIYLDLQGEHTAIASLMSAPGQQQQSSSSLNTGAWTQPPELFQTPQGCFIKITTQRGEIFIQVQGQNLQVTEQAPGMQQAQQMQVCQTQAMPGIGMVTPMQPMQPMQPIQPMQPMQPMEPMKMGEMQMSLNPMHMKMGTMQMQMGKTGSESAAQNAAQNAAQRRFCTQCGQGANGGDRFCAGCGHALAK